MIKSHLAQVVFWSAIVLSVASMASLSILEEPYLWIGVVLVAVSIAFNLWSVYRSDNSGFVQSREFRRAYEPRGASIWCRSLSSSPSSWSSADWGPTHSFREGAYGSF
jgi:ABC-type transport system involved in multi-copper enzyme maturation permease subunit